MYCTPLTRMYTLKFKYSMALVDLFTYLINQSIQVSLFHSIVLTTAKTGLKQLNRCKFTLNLFCVNFY